MPLMGLFDDIGDMVDDVVEAAEGAAADGLAGISAPDAVKDAIGWFTPTADGQADDDQSGSGGGGGWFDSIVDTIEDSIDSAQGAGEGIGSEANTWLGGVIEAAEEVGRSDPFEVDDLTLPDIREELHEVLTDPVTISFGEELGEGSLIPGFGAPDSFATDPTYIDTPDIEFDLGDMSTLVSVDPMLPTPTVHGGTSIAGADVDAEMDSPWATAEVDVQVAATVDPMISVLTPNVGGVAVGGEVTIDVEEPPADLSPAPAADEFESSLQAIDDAAAGLDIFD